jgi:hypothetical protein
MGGRYRPPGITAPIRLAGNVPLRPLNGVALKLTLKGQAIRVRRQQKAPEQTPQAPSYSDQNHACIMRAGGSPVPRDAQPCSCVLLPSAEPVPQIAG